MTSILTELSQWANTLPYWEQAALDKIIAGVQLTESVYDELLQHLLEDADLATSTRPRPELQFPHTATTGFQSSTRQVQLTKISNLQDAYIIMGKPYYSAEQVMSFFEKILTDMKQNRYLWDALEWLKRRYG